jgi:hypothetical protein
MTPPWQPRSSGRPLRTAIVVTAILGLTLAACSASGDDDTDTGDSTGDDLTDTSDTTIASTSTTVDRPDGPAADLSEELTGGDGVFMGSANAYEPGAGYVQEEFVAAGTASSYQVVGEFTEDGEWTFEPDQTADYRTRIVVRRPENPADFSGVVVVEWLNVSGGVDADVESVSLQEEIEREGHIYVGVSAQQIGIEGGPVVVRVEVPGAEAAGQGIKALDPERYGSLDHPGDAFSYDIFTQVARAVRAGSPALADFQPTTVIAAGESQSAFALTTYINGVQPLTHAFDGFFVHSRGAAHLPLPAPGEYADIAGSIGGEHTILRADTDVPIFELQTESDLVGVLGSAAVRQPDTDLFRLWEVPGTAHADKHLAGDIQECGVEINDGPMHLVTKAAFHHLVAWAQGGEPPPEAPRIELTAAEDGVSRDADGIALGGTRTPPVDVPSRVLSGEKGPSDEIICLLVGSTLPMSDERLAELYASRDEFQQKYDEAVDAAIEAGYLLEADREAIEGYAHPELIPD